jgi:hypothetical protein
VYSVFGRQLDPAADRGKEVAVRLKDTAIAGSNEPVAASFDPLVRLSGLRPNQSYVFAIAEIHPSTGAVGKIGPSTHGVVTSYSFERLDAWARLGLAASACGVTAVFNSALGELWRAFVRPDGPSLKEFTAAVTSGQSRVGGGGGGGRGVPTLDSAAVATAARSTVAGFASMVLQLSNQLCAAAGCVTCPIAFLTRSNSRNFDAA